jgi:hypothetical protein
VTPPLSGYSGKPLAKKLGFVEGVRVYAKHAPPDYETLLAPLPAGVVFQAAPSGTTDIIHVFVRRQAELALDLARWRHSMKPAGVIWVSWPKKASKVVTDVTEDRIRELALPLGLVDVKVCAVSDVWSGLKLMIRKELRGARGH